MAGAGVRDLLVDGPWRHRDVAANGVRFHVAVGESLAPDRPLVLLLHGFAQFWWAWRHQIPALDDAGWSVAAMDLRGYGASDKTPRGYDPRSTAGDIAGVVRSLGHRSAVLVGHDWGGMAAWSVAAYAPAQLRALVSVAAPHPAAFPWRQACGELAFQQLPWWPERRMMADHAAHVERLLRSRTAPGSTALTTTDLHRYRDALARWPSPHCALQHPRALVRQQLGAGGRDLRRRLRVPVPVPLLSLHGAADPLLPEDVQRRAEAYVSGPHEFVSLPGVGHLPAEEAPAEVNRVLLGWLAALPPPGSGDRSS